MYDLRAYGRMIADQGRMTAYARALETLVTPGAVVLDIGTGPGIMAFLACRFGASKVYAVEPADVIEEARKAAVANGVADRIEFIRALSTAIELPEKVDGIVADLRGVLPLYGSCVASMLDARNRFLKPGGWVVSRRDTLWAALVSSRERLDSIVQGWESAEGLDFSGARDKVVNTWTRAPLTPEEVLFEPRCWAALDYQTTTTLHVHGEATWTAAHDATVHGVATWFDTETAPGIGFSNSPLSNESHIYRQGFFPWPRATDIQAGSEVIVRIKADFVHGDYIWTWDTTITEPGTRVVATEYHQSTFMAAPVSPDRLRKRAHSFVAQPNGAATIDRRILELMDGRIALAGIADTLLKEFPSEFTDWDAALTRAGDISVRYSE